ncbi:hypothetical protein H920_15021 [Fukomys damarensis]|uniref:Uncharacterized protein n=1 Tax=Fukomys damarensis TaxID=885580 RepID=A0A091CV33_FUKDA|nr:hypothetical protein H920_15021 [Fukomys damarensis]
MSSLSPTSTLEPKAMSLACPKRGSEPGRPKCKCGNQKTYANEMKDLCHRAEGFTLEPGSNAHNEDQSSPDENSSHSK